MAAEQSRDGNNRFRRSKAEVEHDAAAAELRGQGLSYKAIGQRMGCSQGTAHARVHRAFRDTLAEPAEQARAVELARLEDAHDAALAVLLRVHVTVSHGKVITVKDGEGNDTPLIDDAPTLHAIDRIRALSESRRKLLGLDAPQKVALTTEAIDAELASTEAAIAAELAVARSEESETPGTEGSDG